MKNKIKVILNLLFILILSSNLSADDITRGRIEITEEDASPSTFPYQIKFSNASVTDNADGTVSIAGGTGDVSGVGDCASGACLDGTSDGGTWIKFYDAQGAGQLITGNLTGVQTWTLPDATGTVAVSATTPVTLSAAGDIGITVAKDIVAGVGLSGGEDNVLPGADADTTLTLDLTEINSLTWGSGTFTTMTFDAGVTDPVITASSGDLAVSTGTFTLLNTGLHLLDTNASHDLIIKPGSDILADRTLTLTTGDADRAVTINADTTLSGTNTGDQTITLTGDVTGSGTGSFVATIAADSVALGTDTTGNYATGDAEAGAALTGDSATSFFSTGTLEVAIGGTGTTTSTGTGAVVLGTTPTFTTSIILPQGTNPTVGTAGNINIDTTDDQLLYYGGALRTIPYTYEKCFTLETPAAADDNVPIWSPVDAITITSQYCRTQGGTSCEVIISDGTNVMETIICDSDGQADDGTLTNNTFTANERVEFDIGTVTGTVTWVNFCNRYAIDRQ